MPSLKSLKGDDERKKLLKAKMSKFVIKIGNRTVLDKKRNSNANTSLDSDEQGQ